MLQTDVFLLALIRKSSVRAFVRSVEESNGAEAWRRLHSRYAPYAQNRQYDLVNQIKMPVKTWCGCTEGSESGLRGWELDVGEWARTHYVDTCGVNTNRT